MFLPFSVKILSASSVLRQKNPRTDIHRSGDVPFSSSRSLRHVPYPRGIMPSTHPGRSSDSWIILLALLNSLPSREIQQGSPRLPIPRSTHKRSLCIKRVPLSYARSSFCVNFFSKLSAGQWLYPGLVIHYFANHIQQPITSN